MERKKSRGDERSVGEKSRREEGTVGAVTVVF